MDNTKDKAVGEVTRNDDDDDAPERRPRRHFCGLDCMRGKILIMIVFCAFFFALRFVLFVWRYVVPEDLQEFKGLACTIIRYVLHT